MIKTFAALAEPNRYRIVELLTQGPRTVNEIVDHLQLNQPQVSKHLRVLRAAGVVDVEPRAQLRHYQLRGEAFREMQTWLDRYRPLWEARFEALDQVVEELNQQEKKRGRKRKSK